MQHSIFSLYRKHITKGIPMHVHGIAKDFSLSALSTYLVLSLGKMDPDDMRLFASSFWIPEAFKDIIAAWNLNL